MNFKEKFKFRFWSFCVNSKFFPDTQKYAVTLSGANAATCEQLKISLSMFATSGLCGILFTEANIERFLQSPDGNLLFR
jgi:alpha-glucosidase (family GH31 glycosyl hydrolase)